MTIQETIEELVDLWRLRSVFPDKEALLQQALEQCKLTMGSGGEMIGHFPKWTCVIDENGYTCTCPDHQYRGSQCKHLGAVATQVTKNWSEEFPNQQEINNETN